MERHDNHTVSKTAQKMKVPFFQSIRLRILLLALVPMLFSILSIGLLANVSIHAIDEIRDTANYQAKVYQNLTLPNVLCSTLTEYLSTNDKRVLEEYIAVRDHFSVFIDELDSSSDGRPYSQSLTNMGKTLLQLADTAVENLDDEEAMFCAYQEAEELQHLISIFSPYVSKEIETVSANQTNVIISRVTSSIRSDVLILAFILLALILAAALIAGSIIKPLSSLTDAVRSMSISTSDASPSKVGLQDELGILVHAYHDMVKRIHMQLNELEDKQNIERMLQLEKEKTLETESLLTRSELKFYQSQINSHFLFNAFNMVSRLAYIEHAPQVQHAVSLIAQFLRNILTQYDRNITVEEEFSIVENFTEIQDLRFGDRIKVEGSIDPDAEWFIIPALTLQPLVENAYCHGLSARKQGYIRYAAEIDGQVLKLYTWDDGEGISTKRQTEIRQYIEGNDQYELTDCIGLRNVYRRLTLLYPDRVRLLIDSEEGVYTQIGFEITTM